MGGNKSKRSGKKGKRATAKQPAVAPVQPTTPKQQHQTPVDTDADTDASCSPAMRALHLAASDDSLQTIYISQIQATCDAALALPPSPGLPSSRFDSKFDLDCVHHEPDDLCTAYSDPPDFAVSDSPRSAISVHSDGSISIKFNTTVKTPKPLFRWPVLVMSEIPFAKSAAGLIPGFIRARVERVVFDTKKVAFDSEELEQSSTVTPKVLGFTGTAGNTNLDLHQQQQQGQGPLEPGEEPPLLLRAVVAAAAVCCLVLLYPLYVGKLAFESIAPSALRTAVYDFWGFVIDEVKIR